MFGNFYTKNLLVWRWEGRRLNPSINEEVQVGGKRSDLRGISGRFWAAMGAPMAVDARYAHPRLRLVGQTKKTSCIGICK